MSTRKIKDAKDTTTNELVYFKGHAQATFMSDGKTVEEAINSIPEVEQITVDSQMSETSTNPVQNKVLTAEFKKKQDAISDLATIRSNAAKGASALQSVPSEYITETELNAKGYATATQLGGKQDNIADLETIRDGAAKGATAAQAEDITELSNKIDEEKERALAAEAEKLDSSIDDKEIVITDPEGYTIFKVDSEGIHAPNLFERECDDSELTFTDSQGYIICKIDSNGIHSVLDKNAIACMVLSENYYPIAAPTRDSDGNITFAEVMFQTSVKGSLSISYTNRKSSRIDVVYGGYNYSIVINRDSNGNMETVSVN